MSERMIGDKGALKRIGLVPLPADVREKARQKVLNRVKLTKDELQ
jgi:phosphate transport system substrate-binding protein